MKKQSILLPALAVNQFVLYSCLTKTKDNRLIFMIHLSPSPVLSPIYQSIKLPESHWAIAKGKITYHIEPFCDGHRILWIDRISKVHSIFYSSYYDGASWNEPRLLLSRAAAVSSLTIEASKNLSLRLVIWREKTDCESHKIAEVYAMVLSKEGILEPVRISHEGSLASSLDLAIVPDGSKAVITWEQVVDSRTSKIFVSIFERNRFSEPMLISNSDRSSKNPLVVCMEDGTTLINWREQFDISTATNPDLYLTGVGGAALLNDGRVISTNHSQLCEHTEAPFPGIAIAIRTILDVDCYRLRASNNQAILAWESATPGDVEQPSFYAQVWNNEKKEWGDTTHLLTHSDILSWNIHMNTKNNLAVVLFEEAPPADDPAHEYTHLAILFDGHHWKEPVRLIKDGWKLDHFSHAIPDFEDRTIAIVGTAVQVDHIEPHSRFMNRREKVFVLTGEA